MASCKVTGDGDVLNYLEKLSGNISEIAKNAVNEAAQVLDKAMTSTITEVANKGYATGELAGSVYHIPATENNLGVFSVTRVPEGELEERFGYLDIGTKREKYGLMKAQHVRSKTVAKAKAECEAIMERVVEAEVDKQ